MIFSIPGATLRVIFGFFFAAAMTPAEAADLDNVQQWSAKASQLEAAHDDTGAREARVQAIAELDRLDQDTAKRAAGIEAAEYLLLANLDRRSGHKTEAKLDYRRAIYYSEQSGHSWSSGVIKASLQSLEKIYLADSDFIQAEDAAHREIDLVIRFNAEPVYKLEPLMVLGICHIGLGHLTDAKADYDAAWSVAEAVWGVDPVVLRDLLARRVALYRSLQLSQEADNLQQLGQKLIAKREDERVVRAPPPDPVPNPPPISMYVSAAFQFPLPQNCRPVYPRASTLAEEEGNVTIRFKVSKEGQLTDVQLTKSSGFKNLDRAALNSLRLCPVKPATQAGQPVDGEFEWTQKFSLKIK